LLLALGAALVWVLLRPAGPQAVAEDYFEALTRGDAASALALVAAEDVDATVAQAAFEGASGRISGVTVSGVDEDGETATVSVAFSLDSQPGTAAVGLVRTADGWKVTESGLGSMTISSTLGDAAALGTAIVAADEPMLLLPARYDVIPAPVGILTGEASAAVVPGGAAAVDLQPRVADGAVEAAATQVQAYLDACVAPTDSVPESCGIRVPWAADLAALASLAFRVESAPTLAFSDDLSSFAATGGVLVATASGTTRDGSAGSFTYRADEWSLRGGMTFTGNRLVLSVD